MYNYMMYNIICINHIHCIRPIHIYLYIVFDVLLDKYVGNNALRMYTADLNQLMYISHTYNINN